jgi:hypothetical protein
VTSIDGIQVEATLKLNNSGGTTDICVQLSRDRRARRHESIGLADRGRAEGAVTTIEGSSPAWSFAWPSKVIV